MITYNLENQFIDERTGLSWLEKFNAFADKQQKWALGWWTVSLVFIGGFLVPITFLIVYTLGGPVIPFLALSLILFFMIFVSNMCGMSIRTNISLFFIATALHFLMVLFAFVF